MTYNLVPTSDLVSASEDRAGTQSRSAITSLSGGGAVVVYTQTLQPDPNVYEFDYQMLAQHYDASGVAVGDPVVIDTLLNVNNDNQSFYPVVTGLDDGGYAVGWREFGAGDANVRSYDADGTIRGESEIDLPSRDLGNGTNPAVLASGGDSFTINALDTGGFALTWEAGYSGILAQYTGAQIIYTQTFTSDGVAIGTPTAVTPWVGTGSYSVDRWNMVGDSVPLSDGQYIVFMRGGEEAPGNTSQSTAILARIFDENSIAQGDSFMITQDAVDWQDNPSATALPDGGFVVTWRGADVSGWRRFDADGDPVTGDMALDAQYADTNVIAMADGGFLITARYVSSGGAGYTTYGQRIDANNDPVGEMFVITENRAPDADIVTYATAPDFVTLGNGQMMALVEGNTYSDDLSTDVMVRLYLPDALGTAGADQLTAAGGGTAIFGRDGNDLLQGGIGTDHLDGENGNDTMIGALGDDTLVAGAGDDSLEGGAGADVLIEGVGNDTMNGGTGQDTAVFGVRVSEVTVRGPEDGLIITHDGSIDVVQGFENFEFRGTHTTDTRTLAEVLELRDITMHGTFDDDLIYGDYGNDSLHGGYYASGNDTIFGEAGDDSLEGGEGNDVLNGGLGNDTLIGGADDDELNGGAGDDVLDAGADNDTLDGGVGNDTAVFYGFSPASAIVSGPANALTIEYHSYYNTQINVVYNIETFAFETSNDPTEVLSLAEVLALRNREVIGTDQDDVLAGDYGNDTLRGDAGDDALSGGAGNDVLHGDEGNDTILGGDGFDTIIAGSGNDSVVGGNGRDRVYLGTGNDRFEDNTQGGVSGRDTVFAGNGNDLIEGGSGNDSFDGGSGNDVINAGNGDDMVVGGDGFDTVDAGTGNDTVDGGNGRDRISLGDGNDLFNDNSQGGELGRDTVFAGNGNDVIEGGNGDDHFYGGAGNDVINARLGNDMVFAGDGFDTVDAGSGDDTVDGGNGRDRILLGNGNDLFNDNGQAGALGRDTVFGGNGNDRIEGGGGDDRFFGGSGNDVINARFGNDMVYGGDGFDTVSASNGDDTVDGGNGRDLIFLGAGDDRYVDTAQTGNLGQDTISGGLGADTFVFNAVMSADVITDFVTGTDTLEIATALAGGRTNDVFVQDFASVVGGDVVFAFAAGQSITLQGLNSTVDLADDLIFV